MKLEIAFSKLSCKKDRVGTFYAYATYWEAGWLMRMYKTPKGNMLFDYTSPIHVFEGPEIHWMKFGALRKGALDNAIRQLEWSFKIPDEWKKPVDLVWPEDTNKECRFCQHCYERGSTYCVVNKKYTSSLMSCPKWQERTEHNTPFNLGVPDYKKWEQKGAESK